jgi:single-stranded DNA-specific DHH superfamily exonuclease
MINAVQRSGTIEEKELLFKSMLKYEAFNLIDSNKRGHKQGEQEKLVDQAVRTSTNVKNRQTREQDKTMEELEFLIEDLGLLDHKVILFTLDDKELNRNIAGLIANKIANKYQRPCCILSKVEDENETVQKGYLETEPGILTPNYEFKITYQGSARGYEATGVTNFKTICEAAGAEWCQGHENAFGMCLAEDQIEKFLTETDAALADISEEPIYYVDYIYNGADVQASDILTIANLGNL